MRLIRWKDSFSVGVPEFDTQHQQLIALINDLHDARLAGNSALGMRQCLGQLVRFAQEHFAAEERLLSARGYPELAVHKVAHNEFVHKVEAFQKDFYAGREGLSDDIMQFLKAWLVGHILVADKRYGTFLQNNDTVAVPTVPQR